MIKLSTQFWMLVALTVFVVTAQGGYGTPGVPTPVDESADIIGKYSVVKLGSDTLTQNIDF